MQASSVLAILFDFGGVLAEEGFRNGLIQLAREQGLDSDQMPAQGMRAVYDSGFVLGQGTDADFWALLRQRTGLHGSDTDLSQRIIDGFIIRPWIIDLVRQLSAMGFVTGILSDQTHWLDILDQRYHFYAIFHKVYNSFYLGKGKQDISLFQDIADDLDLSPSQILFIDDDGGNTERAAKAGLQTIQYLNREDFIRQLESKLQTSVSST